MVGVSWRSMHAAYYELLEEYGIALEKPAEEPVSLWLDNKCCGPIYLNSREGEEYCSGCGKVVERYVYDPVENEYPQFGEPVGSVGHGYMVKYRPYKPLTHFRDHLRRYCGQKFVEIPEELLDRVRNTEPDVMDKNAYFRIEKELKKIRNEEFTLSVYNKEMRRHETRKVYGRNYYKHIFEIIYKLGGRQPRVGNVRDIISAYERMVYRFSQRKVFTERHSMPSHFMVLDILLRKYGHTPYYVLPKLKDVKSREKVQNILSYLNDN